MKKWLTVVVALVLVLCMSASAGAGEELYAIWDISPELTGYHIAEKLEDRFGFEMKGVNGRGNALNYACRIAGDTELEMFGYNADIEIMQYSPGLTILFDSWGTKNEDEVETFIRDAADRYNCILTSFVAAYSEPEQIIVRHALGERILVDYDANFDAAMHMGSETGLLTEITAICRNVTIAMKYTHVRGSSPVSAAVEIRFSPTVVPLYTPEPDPTPKPTNIPVGFD